MQVDGLPLGALETNCWIVSDDEGGPAIVIDPADDASAILRCLGERPVEFIVVTHAHFDHVGAARDLVAETGAPLAAHAADAAHLTSADGTGGTPFGFHVTAPAADRTLADGEVFSAGRLSCTVLHTPGHTPGGISLLITDSSGSPAHLFSGDTLFAGSVGRTDFRGGDARELARSIAEKLAPLPEGTIVHPGHGPDTTIGREARVNFFWPRG